MTVTRRDEVSQAMADLLADRGLWHVLGIAAVEVFLAAGVVYNLAVGQWYTAVGVALMLAGWMITIRSEAMLSVARRTIADQAETIDRLERGIE